MRKILTLAAVMLFTASINAQKYNMLIHHKSGEVTTMKCEQIEEITFEEAADKLSVPVKVKEEGVVSLKLDFDMPENVRSFFVYYSTDMTDASATVSEIIKNHQYELTEGGEFELKNIPYNTYYKVYTLAFDADGNAGEVEQAAAKTLNVTEPLFTIDVTNIGKTNADVKITPLVDDMTYVYALLDKAKYDAETENYGNIFLFDVDWWTFVGSSQQPPMTWQEAIMLYSKKGEQSFEAKEEMTDIKAGTDHIVYCYGINKFGELTTPIYEKVFKTESVVMSDNKISLEILEVASDYVDVKITTTNDDPYYVTCQKASFVDFYMDDNGNCDYDKMVGNIMNYAERDGFMSGDKECVHLANRKPNTDYYIIVYGYDGGMTTVPVMLPFHTNW